MKLFLQNFRNHKNSTFEFEKGNLVLVHGPTGSGKTSIFLGIIFAIYGSGSDIISLGEKKCLVKFEIDNMIIKSIPSSIKNIGLTRNEYF